MSISKKVKPLGNRVLIKRSKATASKGGIILPDTAQEKPKEGVVVSVGSGKVTDDGIKPLSLKENDRVLFSSYAGTEVKGDIAESEDEEYLIMSEDDVLGVLS